MPGCTLIDDPIVIPLVSSASSWTATKGITHILLFHAVVHQLVVLLLLLLLSRRRGSRSRVISLSTFTAGHASLIGSCHRGMERSKIPHHLLVLLLLVSMDGLRMLTQIIKTRELLAAMTSERTFARVFPDVPGQVFAPTENHTTLAIPSALKSLSRGRAITFVNTGCAREQRSGVVMGY